MADDPPTLQERKMQLKPPTWRGAAGPTGGLLADSGGRAPGGRVISQLGYRINIAAGIFNELRFITCLGSWTVSLLMELKIRGFRHTEGDVFICFKHYLHPSFHISEPFAQDCPYRDCLESLLKQVSLLHDGLQDRQRTVNEMESESSYKFKLSQNSDRSG